MVYLLFFACQQNIAPPRSTTTDDPSRAWKSLLLQATTEKGVDYDLIEKNREILDNYVQWVGTVGPQMNRRNRTPWPRKNRSDRRLTFFANAYNAWVIYSVLAHRPLESVRDVDVGMYTQPNVGFFFGQRFKVDGEYMSLYHLEQERLLGDHQEPLIHVMLNCASIGCPPLQYWSHTNLTKDAEEAMRDYLKSPQGARQTDSGWEFTELFDWYEEDFVVWSDAENLCQYLEKYSAADIANWLREQPQCNLSFFSYDWSVNDISDGSVKPVNSTID